MDNRISINKKKLRKILYIYMAILLVLIFSSRTIYNISLPRVSVVMPQSGSLTKVFEARGVVRFSETFDIYAVSGGQIDEMFIRKGDLINENTVIATYKAGTTDADNSTEAGFTIARIENQLDGLALNRSAIQDRLRALSATSTDDLHSYQWAVMDAAEMVENRQIELMEAQRFASIVLNGYYLVQATTNTERDWNSKVTELTVAQAHLLAVEKGSVSDFDDYAYQLNIQEGVITLERRRDDFIAAEEALTDAKRNRSSSFDNYTYQNAINTVRTAYDRSLEDYNENLRQYDRTVQFFHHLILTSGQASEIEAAQRSIDDAQNRILLSLRTLDDTNAALEQAINDMRRAENTFNTNNSKTRNQAIAEVEVRVRQTGLAVDDAERAYENAVNELNRAAAAFSTNTEEAREKAISDAEEKVETALVELEEIIWNAQQSITVAETNLANAQTALERAETNLELARIALTEQAEDSIKSLNLELQRTDLEIARTNIDLQAAEMAMEAYNNSTPDIRADYKGVVMSVEKSRGQFVAQGERIATAGINNNIFICEIISPESDGRFIEFGDEANIRKSGSTSIIKAVVCDIVPEGDLLRIILTFETHELNGGEYVTVNFNKQTETYYTIVPNEGIFREGTGSFVWVVRSRQGALGTEYFTVKVRVIISDSDDFYTSIVRGLEGDVPAMPVVVSRDRDLTMNGRVRRME